MTASRPPKPPRQPILPTQAITTRHIAPRFQRAGLAGSLTKNGEASVMVPLKPTDTGGIDKTMARETTLLLRTPNYPAYS